MEKDVGEKHIEQTCEYLGTIPDPLVCYNFPHPQNHCYRVKKPAQVNLNYQENICLSCKYDQCAIYQQENLRHLPDKIARGRQEGRSYKFLFFRIAAMGLILAAAMIAVRIIRTAEVNNPQSLVSPTMQEFDTLIPTDSTEPSITPEEMDVSMIIPTQTPPVKQKVTPEAEIEITPTGGPGFSTPFGFSQKYVIHEVQSGESLSLISDKYNTTIDSIVEINSLQAGNPIWINQIIVVKPGATTIESEKLEAIYIEEDTPLVRIAEDYAISIEKLKDMNALGGHEIIPAGRWLVVPQK